MNADIQTTDDKEALGAQLREHLTAVRELRQRRADDPCAEDHLRLKAWQSARLAQTHADLLADPRYRPAAEFFLAELYGTRDFTARDEETARVIPVLVAMLPRRALATIVEAVRMDALSESLDTAMVEALRAIGSVADINATSYAAAYRRCNRRADREEQLHLVEDIGGTLDRLTHMPLLLTSLRLMKTPAEIAGLGNLHSFLQRGFDAFRHMRGADHFLEVIIGRERALMDELLRQR